MREIDCAHCQILKRFSVLTYFRFNTHISSLNQDQGRVLKGRECAQSIPLIENPL
jgi:hypothetical protein